MDGSLPRIGRPYGAGTHPDLVGPWTTLSVRPVRKEFSHSRKPPLSPNVTCNCSSRMSWSTVSKAVLTSKSASNVSSERSIAPYVSDKRRNRRVSVEWNRLNLDWQDGRRLFFSRWQISWYATIFSIIFDRNETKRHATCPPHLIKHTQQ